MRALRAVALLTAVSALVAACGDEPAGVDPRDDLGEETRSLDERLRAELMLHEVTGRVESTLEARLGRPVDNHLAEVGRLLFFDPVLSITEDNSCSGCHGPNASFNDSESIAIGVGNNGVVGPDREGPRNLRRAPTVINAAFYPNLMWDSRFSSESLDPFDNSRGFSFPPPDGTSLSHMEHLVGAQAFTPVTTRAEMTGFDFEGDYAEIRTEVAGRVDAIDEYRERFAEVFPEIAAGEPIRYRHIGAAIAEFLFTLVRADAPIDQYARGDDDALTTRQKRGALLFFGAGECAECHITQGYANEMYSDFDPHVIGTPQVSPTESNMAFDGPGRNEDYGQERQTGDPEDRYEFRTQPLRNVALQPTFMHNGAYRCLEDAIRQHTRPYEMARGYDPGLLDPTMQGPLGPVEPVLDRLNNLIRSQPVFTERQFQQIVEFVRVGLTDPEAKPEALRHLIPESVPSGLPVHDFQFDERLSPTCIG